MASQNNATAKSLAKLGKKLLDGKEQKKFEELATYCENNPDDIETLNLLCPILWLFVNMNIHKRT